MFAKKGLHKIIGRGEVVSDYVFDDERNEHKHIRKIKWTHKGEWDHPHWGNEAGCFQDFD
ncbi:MAG: hypothetical protein R2883_05160 [Caldisericia bacterium]